MSWRPILYTLIVFAFQGISVSGEDEQPDLRSAFPLDALSSVTQGDAKLTGEILIRKIVEEEGYSYSAEIPRNHELFLAGLKNDRYDLFLMFAYEYLRNRDSYAMTPKMVGQRTVESELFELMLLIPADAELDDARHGKLLVQRGSGELPLMWLEEELSDRNVAEPESFFDTVEVSENTNKTVLTVFFGKADACIVSREAFEIITELNPQIGQKLKAVAVSEPFLNTIICIRDNYHGMDPDLIVEVGTNLHNSPDGQQVLTLFRVERLNRFDSNSLVSLESFLTKRAERLKTE